MSATKGARFAAFGALILLAACSGVAPIVPVSAPPTDSDASSLTLRVTDYLDIPGWNGDDHASVLPTLIRSCEKIEAKDPSASLGSDLRMGRVEDWMAICADARKIRPGNMVEAKYFFESRFIAYRVGDVHDTNGLFTGYYEPELNGRWAPQEGFQTPIYARPKDIISINLADFRSMYVGANWLGGWKVTRSYLTIRARKLTKVRLRGESLKFFGLIVRLTPFSCISKVRAG